MMRLVGVELTRYLTRRAIALLIITAVLLSTLVAFKSAWDTRPASEQEVATAEAQAGIEATRDDIRNDLEKCLRDPAAYLGPRATEQMCRDALVPAASSFLRPPLDLDGTLKGNGPGLAVLVIALLIIAASTFAGGDWASGSMATQLLHEPRRFRLWSAKAVAVTLASGVVTLVCLAGFWAALYAVTLARDIDTSGGVLDDVIWHVVRAVVLAMGAGLGAYALTMVFRHTVGTLALLFAYSVGGELLVTVPFEGAARWSLGNNVFGWLERSLQYLHPRPCVEAGTCSPVREMSHLDAGLYLLVLLLVAVIASIITFSRRDV